MEQIPEDKFLQYNPDTLIALRKLYNLDKPGQMDEAIDILDAWVKEQSHLVKKDYSRDYLERVIILLKGSVERAKAQINKICTLRTQLPQFFEKVDAKNDYKLLKNYQSTTLLPRLTEDHTRLLMKRFEHAQFTSKDLLQTYFYDVLILEYLKAHDYSDGIISIIDLRAINNFLYIIPRVSLTDLKQQSTILLQGYGTRVKKIIIISTSSTVYMMVRILKQIVSKKVGQRIDVVSNLENLHDLVPKALLPSDYGGEEKPLAVLQDEFQEVLASKENVKYLKEISKARINETQRTTSKFMETIRTLWFN